MLHDRAEHRRLQVRPRRCVLGDGDEVVSEEDAVDPGDCEQATGERRVRRLVEGAVVDDAVLHHRLAGDELQRLGIGRGFGLDEHAGSPGGSRPPRSDPIT